MQEPQETWVQSLVQEDPLKKDMTTQSSIPAWKIPWTEELGGYSPWCHKVRHDQHIRLHTRVHAHTDFYALDSRSNLPAPSCSSKKFLQKLPDGGRIGLS